MEIFAGATNHSLGTITYTGLMIKGGSGNDGIENDAPRTVLSSMVMAKIKSHWAEPMLGPSSGTWPVIVLASDLATLGTNEAAGSALGDKVTFGSASTAELFVFQGAEAGSTAGTKSIGPTKVVNAADGMEVEFGNLSHFIFDATTTVASATSLTAAENAAVNAFGSSGVVYFSFHGNEYFIASKNIETMVSSSDAIVELVGVTDIHHATNNFGLVTLHV